MKLVVITAAADAGSCFVDVLVTQHPGGHEDNVEVTEALEDLGCELGVPAGVGDIELHFFDDISPGRAGHSRRLGPTGGLPAGQDDGPAPSGDQLADDGLCDLGRPSQH